MSLAVSRQLTPGFVLSDGEAQSMEFFSTWAASRLGGWLDADFWQSSVLQLCHTEPFALNAALAISTLYRGSIHRHARDRTSSHQVVRFYNKAIQATRVRIQAGGLQPALAVTSCALFICIEFLRDDIVAARSLIVQGIQLLRTLVVGPDQQSHVSFFRGLLIRLKVLAATFGDPNAAKIELQVSNYHPAAFESLESARSSLFAIMAKSHPFLKEAMAWRAAALENEFNNDLSSPKAALTTRQSALRRLLDSWSTTFTEHSPGLDTAPADSKSLLLMYYHTSRIWLLTQLDFRQTAFDGLTYEFEQAVYHAELYVNARAAENTHLTFEFGAVPILYFVAIRCRVPCLRRKALALLAKAPKRESVYDAQCSADLAARIIAFEEEGLGLPDARAEGFDAIDVDMNVKRPAESRRAHVLQAAERSSADSRNVVVTRYAISDRGRRCKIEEDLG